MSDCLAPKLVLRSEWKAAPPMSHLARIPRFSRIGIHYSTGQELGVEDCAAWVRSIQAYHQRSKGWADVGYNFLVCKHGTVFEGRGWDYQGAHCPGRNHDSIGICFLGNDDQGVSDVTTAAKSAILFLIEEFKKRFGNPVEVFPHRKYKATECPGDELTAWIAAGLL